MRVYRRRGKNYKVTPDKGKQEISLEEYLKLKDEESTDVVREVSQQTEEGEETWQQEKEVKVEKRSLFQQIPNFTQE